MVAVFGGGAVTSDARGASARGDRPGHAASATTFVFASATSFAAGDRLEVTAPVSPDATLADVAITLTGTRS